MGNPNFVFRRVAVNSCDSVKNPHKFVSNGATICNFMTLEIFEPCGKNYRGHIHNKYEIFLPDMFS